VPLAARQKADVVSNIRRAHHVKLLRHKHCTQRNTVADREDPLDTTTSVPLPEGRDPGPELIHAVSREWATPLAAIIVKTERWSTTCVSLQLSSMDVTNFKDIVAQITQRT
jgi:hypothetical protein